MARVLGGTRDLNEGLELVDVGGRGAVQSAEVVGNRLATSSPRLATSVALNTWPGS